MPSRHFARQSARRRRMLLEDLESRLLLTSSVPSYDFGVITNFNVDKIVGNGGQPDGLVIDTAGDIFGTTSEGGAQGFGTIFKIAAGTNTLTTLVSFTTDTGFFPSGQLVVDSSGNLFGTALNGGAFNRGTIFELKSGASTITTLASFNGPDGAYPASGLTMSDGILYGETFGRNDDNDRAVVFTLDPNAPVIHDIAFVSTDTNVRSDTTLAIDSSGDIFGTTTNGGVNSRGSIFEIVAGTSIVKTVYSFDNFFGQTPLGHLLMDADGNLIGATSTGGSRDDGSLFSFNPTTGAITTLVSFDVNNGQHPVGNLIFDPDGNILGTTAAAGPKGFGTVFSFNPNTRSLTTLYFFNSNKTDPQAPTGDIVMDADGNIYGGTFGGGTFQHGTLYELSAVGAPQIPVKIVVVQQPQNSLAGNTFAISVGIEDIFGHLVSTDTSDVTVTLTTPNNGAALDGTLTITAGGGLATFTDLEIDTAGTYSLTITDGTFTKVITQNFTISANAADNPHLVFSPDPAYFTVGKSAVTPFSVFVEDNFGNIIKTDHSKITIAAQAGLSGILTAPVLAGVANFNNIQFSAAGSYTLTATDTKAKVSDPDVTGASVGVTVGTVAKAIFGQQPTAVLAGHDIAPSVIVSLQDGSGQTVAADSGTTVTLSIISAPAGGQFYLGGSTHADTLTTTDASGNATFANVEFDTAGTYVIAATVNGLTTIVSKSFVVSPDTATEHLVFTTQPTDTGILSPIKPAVVVKLEDQFGNIFIKDNSRITLSATGPGALSGTTFMNAHSGIATFSNLQLAIAGSYTLHAVDGAITAADSDGFVIGAATHLVFTVQPTKTVAGHTISTFKVSVEDATNHVVVGDASAITLDLSFFLPGNGATLSGTTTVNAVNGVATFTDISTTTAGNYTLAATDGSLTAGVSGFFVISPDVATHLFIFQQPEDVGANTKMIDPVIVYVEDQFNNIVTTDSSKVTLTPTPGSTVSNNSVNASKGIATFTSFTVNTAGSYTLTASDGALTTAITGSFDVAAAAKLVFSQGPTTTAAGTAIAPSLVVKVENSAGQVVTTDNSAVTITFTQPHDSGLTGTLTVNAVNGIATFTGVIPTIEGFYSLTATDGNLIHAVSSSFTVNSSGTVTQLVFSQQPGTTIVAGAAINPNVIVKLEDQFGNIVTGSNAPVTITASGPGAFGGTGHVTVNASQGVATFSNLTLKVAGDYTLSASALTFTTTSDDFRVIAGAPTHMIFSEQPTETSPGIVSAQVTLLDSFNNITVNSAVTVTLVISSGPANARLGGVTTAAPVTGQVNFTDVIPQVGGTYVLKAISSNLPQRLADPFTILGPV